MCNSATRLLSDGSCGASPRTCMHRSKERPWQSIANNSLYQHDAGLALCCSYIHVSGYSTKLSRPSTALQGQDTNSQAVANLRAAVQEGKDCSAEVLNYRKNGELGCMQMSSCSWQWL